MRSISEGCYAGCHFASLLPLRPFEEETENKKERKERFAQRELMVKAE